jgi:hypothetical protein
MTAKAKNTEPAKTDSNQVNVVCKEGEDPELATTRVLMGPSLTNANIAARFAKGQFGRELDLPSAVTAIIEVTKRVKANDMSDVEATLVCQATSLNSMFCELSRRAAANMGEYIEASDRYMRLALKAQNQCRMTLETLSNIKNPPVVYAKQANISNGPQQVNNTLHAHAGENKNQPSKVLEQGHEQRMDTPAQSQTSVSNSELETVGKGNGA